MSHHVTNVFIIDKIRDIHTYEFVKEKIKKILDEIPEEDYPPKFDIEKSLSHELHGSHGDIYVLGGVLNWFGFEQEDINELACKMSLEMDTLVIALSCNEWEMIKTAAFRYGKDAKE
jgi:hypothetical protein